MNKQEAKQQLKENRLYIILLIEPTDLSQAGFSKNNP